MKSLVILAGGKSSRMGRDKVLLEIDGMTFVERIYQNATKNFDRIIISTDTDKHADAIRSLKSLLDKNLEIVTDSYNAVGPMGGIRTVFEKTDVSRFSIISVDVPFADMNVLEAIYDRCDGKAAFLKMKGKKAEPLIAAYDRSSYGDIKAAVDNGLFKMRMAFPQEDIRIINEEELQGLPGIGNMDFEAAFENCNTPEEYSHIEKK